MKVTWCYDASTLRPLERSFFARERTHTFNAEGSDVRRLMLEKRDGRVSTPAATAGLFRSAATQALKSIDQRLITADFCFEDLWTEASKQMSSKPSPEAESSRGYTRPKSL